MTNLKLSQDLSLPIDAATQTFAFIGRKGSGKTYGAGKLVELFIDHKIQVAILDTVGNWYGLRISANGKDAGLDVPIFGGLRGDIPLEPTGGALVADVLIESGKSVVIDMSQFNKADRQRFATAFGERLWKLKKAEHHPTPIHLVIEESQLIIPEAVRGDSAQMVGIYEEIVRLGRNYGIGISMLTQRPQSVNKEVLNQTECLMAFQVNGAHERKALKEWITHQGMDVNLLNELPSLKPGSCYLWSPQWLEVLKKIKISEKRTFDSTSTPKSGGVSRGKGLKPIDLDTLKEKMQATIERQKAEDPKELKKKIAELERQLKSNPEIKETKVETKIKEIPVLKDNQIERLEKALELSVSRHKEILEALQLIQNHNMLGMMVKKKEYVAPLHVMRPIIKSTDKGVKLESGDKLPIGEEKILSALIQYPNGLQRKQLTVLCGYKQSARDTYISRLSQRGYARIGQGSVVATEEGINALPNYEPLPKGDDLQNYWLNRLPKGEKVLLEILIAEYPNGVRRDYISEKSQYKQSARDTYISRLAGKELLTISGPGEVCASENLF